MNLFEKYLNILKIGDELVISKRPDSWSNAVGGECGLNIVSFPYSFTIKNMLYREGPAEHIAMEDYNGYGWSINRGNGYLFEIKVSRKNRIDKLFNKNE